MEAELATRAAVALREEQDLYKRVAMDVGKEVCAYIEVMYPEAVEAASSTFLLSLRNTVYNEIMGVINANKSGYGEETVEARLVRRAIWRKQWKAMAKKNRQSASPESVTK